ncbi:OTU domain-containing protein 3 [Aplysia californica]|uniref:OTU domain-containing protein 3 n=1 Tax=Aplysia californica TaxID=6500 RepID=A0ABM1VY13_APLCA|nr:OTU domain-containing protein 3 [Aplysia californica]
MPGRVYSGGGNFYRQGSAKMTRNIGGDMPQHHQNGQGHAGGNFPHSAAQRSKQEERAIREAHRKEVKLDSYLADDENFPSFKIQLAKMALQLRDIPADGNCLFRALGDQLEGHCRNHFRHRTDVVNFMRNHRLDFEPFVEDDVTFDDHMRNLQRLGTHAGNDAIVAFAKLHGVNVVIHQLNGKPLLISGPPNNSDLIRQLHIAYHNGDHYSSVRRLDDNTESPAHIRLQDSGPESKQKQVSEHCGGVVRVHRGLEDIENEVMLATQCSDIERVREALLDCEYDVDASIADLLQQMELRDTGGPPDDNTSLTSKRTSTDSGVFNGNGSTTTNSNSSSPNSNSGRIAGSALKTNGNGSVNGKGHKVHFREDSYGGSSGYGSLNSNKGGGARPKMAVVPQVSAKKLKEAKKLEKKRRAEERHRQKFLGGGAGQFHPQASDVRDVTVVDQRQTHVVSVPGGRLTSI